MEIVDNKALVLKLRKPHRVTAVIPYSKELPDNRVVVRWGLDEVQYLRNININAPSPIEGRYGWPGLHRPFAHQKKTAAFLTLNRRAFCFNEQGTGKTASAIWAADYLMTQNKVHRVLVVCPLSVMSSTWRDDLFSFAMHRTVAVAHGAAPKRRKIVSGTEEFVVINYDGIEVVFDEIKAGGFDLIIVDEATHYKNPKTTRWKLLNKLIAADTWVWLMTGTPAAQGPTDAYGLAKLINPNGVPAFFSAFRDQVMYKVSQFRWVPKDTAADTVYRALQPAIRFTKEECLDLPEMVFVKRHVPLTKQQRKYYEELRNRMVIVAAGEEVTALNAAGAMNKLLQISAGSVYTDDGESINFDIKERYKVLREVMDEASAKVIVFVPFRNVIDVLVQRLRDDGFSTEMIRGDVPEGARTRIFNAFQRTPDPKVLVIQPRAASHGVTLTAADTIIWWGPTSSLETYSQANARIHRAGQGRKCTVVQLQGSPVESHVYALLDNKIDVHTKIIDLYKDMLV